jgi:EKC/KEOPS complex subunit CGI121/TPRKB
MGQIAESFRKFGLTDSTKNLLVVKASVTPDITRDSVAEHLGKVIEATPIPFKDETLATISDVGKIRKAYKVGSTPTRFVATAADLSAGTLDHNKRYLQACILGAVALRGAS